MQRRVVLICALAVVAVGLGIGIPVAVTSGGNSPSSRTSEPAQPLAGARIADQVGAAYELVAARASQPSTTGNLNALAGAEQKFSLALLRQLSDPEKNVTVSPASLGLALAMLEHGAAGSTLTQIQQALQTAEMSPDEQGAAWAALVKAWDDPSSSVELHAANSIWDQKGFQPSAQFLDALQRFYSAGVWQANFADDPSDAAKAINMWVSQHTKGKIPQLFGTLSPDTRVVLANALYFKAEWANTFDTTDTRPGDFTAPGGTVSAQFMHQQSVIPLAQSPDATAVQLPYTGGRFAAVAIMPTSGTLADYTSGLSVAKLNALVDGLNPTAVDLSFPKFKSTSSLDLNSTLQQLGMRTAFTPHADLSKLSTQQLNVSEVVQKDYLAVTEKGTEAAAATGVGVVAGATMQATPISFDHPFLFLIRDVQTGAILFASQIQNPAAG